MKTVTARVQITVEIDVRLENWAEDSTVAQVHREGGEKAVARITDLCQRYVRLVGAPRIEAIITEKK